MICQTYLQCFSPVFEVLSGNIPVYLLSPFHHSSVHPKRMSRMPTLTRSLLWSSFLRFQVTLLGELLWLHTLTKATQPHACLTQTDLAERPKTSWLEQLGKTWSEESYCRFIGLRAKSCPWLETSLQFINKNKFLAIFQTL